MVKNGVLIFVFAKYLYLCITMRRVLSILLFALCLALFGQGSEGASVCIKKESESLKNRYTEQIDCQQRCNNFAHRTESISVPATSVTTFGVKSFHPRLASVATATISTGTNYLTTNFSYFIICGRRAIDYYLYTLCQLRL